ncbi:DUF6093 family protein [Brevibacterium luteolum]|uniref:Uncharacterized protein n=1 Tax=Brevibacterium luteolum TaxID=199591 RepID=A0A849AMK3_9MICO|nr:hypothetical protein [Brevibacterium luteolum]NNG77837.1 hypothetical protein [Brevibacterium luteolum]
MSARRAAAALMRGRRAAKALMVDRCTISRVTGETTDRTTGKVVPLTEQIYPNEDYPVGCCKLTSYEGYEAEQESAGADMTEQRMSIHLPVGSVRVNVGDIVEITYADLDPLLVGRTYRISQEAPFRTYSTAYRIFVDYIAD